MLALGNLFDPIQQLSQLFNQLQSAGAALHKLFELLDTPVDIVEPKQPEALPRRGEIRVEDVSFAYALMAPAGTPEEIVQLLGREVQKAMAQPDVQEKNRIADYAATGLDPKQSAAWLAAARDKWTGVINKAGISPE